VSASNGIRESVATCVGYPKDVVAAKYLNGRKIVFGSEAVELRTSLEFYQPLARGVIKKEGLSDKEAERQFQAARDIVRHAIGLVRDGHSASETYCVIGAPARASDTNKRLIVDAVKDLVDSVLICSEPFAVAYGMDRLDEALVIDIGAGTVDLCRMHGTLPDPEDQITLETAGDYVDQQLLERMQQSCKDAQFNIHMVKRIKEQHATVEEVTYPIEVSLPVDGRPTTFDVSSDVRAACMSIVQPMAKALQKLIATFEPDLQHRMRNNVLLGGGGSQIRGLDRALEKAMEELGGGKVSKVEEPLFAGGNGALKIAQDMPAEHWEQLT
jgi:rod shape-determining protein MreB